MRRMARKSFRPEIIQQGRELFLEQGGENISFSQIAQRVKIAQPSIYNHLANKTDLLVAIFEDAVSRGRVHTWPDALVDESADKKLHYYMTNTWNFFRNNREAYKLTLARYYYATFNDEVRKINEKTVLVARSMIKKIIDEGVEQGVWTTESSEATASTIQGILMAELIMGVHGTAVGDGDAQLRRLIHVIEKLLNAPLIPADQH